MKFTAFFLTTLLAVASLGVGQEATAPAALATEPAKSEAVEPPAAPTPPEPPRKPGLRLEWGDSSHLSAELKEKLTSQQIFDIEMARAKNRNRWRDAENVVVPIVFFLMVFGLFAVPAWLHFRQKRIMHETIRLLAEKGQPIPPEMFMEKPARKSDLRRGIVLCALGIGLIILFLNVSRNVWAIGAIPLFLGVGYLVAWRIERGKSEQVSV